jgi:hypothetical protein
MKQLKAICGCGQNIVKNKLYPIIGIYDDHVVIKIHMVRGIAIQDELYLNWDYTFSEYLLSKYFGVTIQTLKKKSINKRITIL